jgi:peptidyl-prolyl cis-trans isomerase B (cyclophilin B)
MKEMRKRIYLFSMLLPLAVFTLNSCSNSVAGNENGKNQQKAVPREEAQQDQKAVEEKPEQLVKISTEYGDMVIKLYNGTPLHRDNFIKLVKEHYYDSLLFHRVINGFMIQGGDPQSKHAQPGQMLGNGGPGYTVPAEFRKEYFHKKGALAAAREPDQVNPQKASSGSQFYIVQGRTFTNMELNQMEQQMMHRIPWEQKEVYMKVGGTPHLDGNYTVFGEVISGMEVIDKIAAVQTDRNNRPVKDVRMTITLLDE